MLERQYLLERGNDMNATETIKLNNGLQLPISKTGGFRSINTYPFFRPSVVTNHPIGNMLFTNVKELGRFTKLDSSHGLFDVLSYLKYFGLTRARLEISVNGRWLGCKQIEVKTKGMEFDAVIKRCNTEFDEKVLNAIQEACQGSNKDTIIVHDSGLIEIALLGSTKASVRLHIVP